MSGATRVLGVDPGTRLCGWAIVSRDGSQITHVDNGVVALTEGDHLADRLAELLRRLERVIAEYNPHVAAVEGVFAARNPRSALILGHARGVALAAAAKAGLSVHEYTPQQVKKAVTGSGRAAKEQVADMVTLRLALTERPQEDAADAVAVAMCHAQHLLVGAPPKIPARPRGGKRKADAGLRALVMAQEKARRSGGKA
jgi:crossover junction endodeoxyribonuclease RuvC